ncbi:MAG TPA: hypothetical protein VIC26_02560 [Marinagarivorans sp.]
MYWLVQNVFNDAVVGVGGVIAKTTATEAKTSTAKAAPKPPPMLTAGPSPHKPMLKL